jgi:hypothetical protein
LRFATSPGGGGGAIGLWAEDYDPVLASAAHLRPSSSASAAMGRNPRLGLLCCVGHCAHHRSDPGMHPRWQYRGSRIEYGVARPRVGYGRGEPGCWQRASPRWLPSPRAGGGTPGGIHVRRFLTWRSARGASGPMRTDDSRKVPDFRGLEAVTRKRLTTVFLPPAPTWASAIRVPITPRSIAS